MQKGIDYPGICVTYICHDGAGRVLMQKRSANCRDEHNRWDTGSGGLDLGETVEDTLRKEIKEEYCADVLEHEFLGYRDVHREHDGTLTHWLALDFKVRVNAAQVKNGEPHKFMKIGWFTIDALPEPLHSQLADVFEHYKEKLRNIA